MTTSPSSANAPASIEAAPEDSSLAQTDITTQMTFAVPPARAWEGLMFYEQLDERPPMHLRLLLPVPIRTVGRKSEVGDEALCLYEGGQLVKRVTEVDAGRLYAFRVVKQELKIGGGMKLWGGSYTLRELPGGRTEITAFTRYLSPKRPRWLWEPVEAMVGHMFHRHILEAMRRAVEA